MELDQLAHDKRSRDFFVSRSRDVVASPLAQASRLAGSRASPASTASTTSNTD
jgi:hypothetical protein